MQTGMKTGAYSQLEVAEVSSELSEHLIGLPDAEFALWRCIGLRGAGFPAGEVLRLGAPQALIDAADELLRLERELEALNLRALAQVNGVLDHLRESGEWEDKSKHAPMEVCQNPRRKPGI
jgi:hypothetical protein